MIAASRGRKSKVWNLRAMKEGHKRRKNCAPSRFEYETNRLNFAGGLNQQIELHGTAVARKFRTSRALWAVQSILEVRKISAAVFFSKRREYLVLRPYWNRISSVFRATKRRIGKSTKEVISSHRIMRYSTGLSYSSLAFRGLPTIASAFIRHRGHCLCWDLERNKYLVQLVPLDVLTLSALGCRGGGRVVLLPAVRRRRRGWGWCCCLGGHPRGQERFCLAEASTPTSTVPSAAKEPATTAAATWATASAKKTAASAATTIAATPASTTTETYLRDSD